MGIEFRDATYLLSGKNTRVLKKDMLFNLSLGFSGIGDSKYALHLVDTVQVDSDKSVPLTEGCKSVKDTLFFLTSDSDAEAEEEAGGKDKATSSKPAKKPPTKPIHNGSPAKMKSVGGKQLRNQNRRAVQDEVHQSQLAKLIEHQKELANRLQEQGLAKFSENGAAVGGKEGKGWKKFQSYKGEFALPPEIERLRVRSIFLLRFKEANVCWIDLCGSQSAECDFASSWLCGAFPHQHDQECK